MKKIFSLIIAILLLFCAASAETVEFYDIAFTLPENWQKIPLTEEQLAEGWNVCYGDGTLRLMLRCDERTQDFTDINAYAEALEYPGAFVAEFNGLQFAMYNDLENGVALCTAAAGETLMYTIAFSPVTDNEETSLTILGIMETISTAGTTEAQE